LDEPNQDAAESGTPHKPAMPPAETAVIPVSAKLQTSAAIIQADSSPMPHGSNPMPNIAVDVPAKQSEIETKPVSAPETPPAHATVLEELPTPNHDSTQPLRAVSLEFSPDGAGDVKLRLSEKAGDVHIKLHSADPSLAGRLHAGVSDLIGSLSHAGYEAEAWTAGQGQRQHREPQERRSRRPDGDVLGGESFGGFLQQSEF